ncbi:MAG: AmmeMemoRadiSam system radical SAM enzyme [Candidatus Aenigmatarchaeota archaeon]
MREAVLYKIENDKIICTACARYCKLSENQIGFCGVRIAKDKKLYLMNYGIFASYALDPIEKKPLFHFYPGSTALSFGTTGCNFACKYCCNFDLSQRRKAEGIEISVEKIYEKAKELKEKFNVSSITFTYNEPIIYSEFIYDAAKILKKEFKITLVSNGYFSNEAIDFISKFVDAIDIDIKGNANDEFAKKFILIPNYEPTLNAIEELYKKGIHVEITDLIVPKVGENLEDCRKLCKFIYDLMGENAFIHFLRFFPSYKMMDYPETSLEVLEKHAEIAKNEGINYVYIGNVWGHELENTYCPNCKKAVIKRYGFAVTEVNLDGSKCKFCGYNLPIVGEAKISKLTFPIFIDL